MGERLALPCHLACRSSTGALPGSPGASAVLRPTPASLRQTAAGHRTPEAQSAVWRNACEKTILKPLDVLLADISGEPYYYCMMRGFSHTPCSGALLQSRDDSACASQHA